jgi:hypothetical protein
VVSGADWVLAMQARVTDGYAAALVGRFYSALAADSGTSAAGALAEARVQLEDERQATIRAGGSRSRPEYGVPTLICAGSDGPLRDAQAAAEPLAHPTELLSGGSARELKVGQLIGRRHELRTALAALRGGQAAVDRWGTLSGVVLTGIGGIGKTAVAGQAG